MSSLQAIVRCHTYKLLVTTATHATPALAGAVRQSRHKTTHNHTSTTWRHQQLASMQHTQISSSAFLQVLFTTAQRPRPEGPKIDTKGRKRGRSSWGPSTTGRRAGAANAFWA